MKLDERTIYGMGANFKAYTLKTRAILGVRAIFHIDVFHVF